MFHLCSILQFRFNDTDQILIGGSITLINMAINKPQVTESLCCFPSCFKTFDKNKTAF